MAGFATREGIPFPLLADADREMIRAYGVYVRINFESWNMARPAVVLIDPAGIAREVWVGRHQREWPVTEDLWAVIDRHERALRAMTAVGSSSPSRPSSTLEA